jgi:metal-dependent amidase/aminoacylase/carboxypeptidase family protein
MFENPEVAYEERASSARLVQFLRDNGFEVEYPAYGLDTAFAARIGSGDHHVAICAEYDALPGVGHACGHNIIATSALGAGYALAPLVDDLGITLTVLGTPAEEKYGGKIDLIEADAFEEIDAAMMVHPSTADVVDPLVIAVAHSTSTTGARPPTPPPTPSRDQRPRRRRPGLRQHLHPAPAHLPHRQAARHHRRGGRRPQRDPRLHPLVLVRAGREPGPPRRAAAPGLACFEAAATATGCDLEVEYVGHTYDELISNPTMTEMYARNSASLGRTMLRGSDLPPSQTGSTDMGNVSRIVPSIHPMLSIHCLPIVNHQKEFAAHTVTPAGEKAIHDGALGMAWTIIDVAEGDAWDRL